MNKLELKTQNTGTAVHGHKKHRPDNNTIQCTDRKKHRYHIQDNTYETAHVQYQYKNIHAILETRQFTTMHGSTV